MRPTSSLEELLQYLVSPHVSERQQAVIELARMQDERLIAPLMQALNDSDSTVRANAASGLGHNRARQAFEALLARLQDPDELVKERSATALAQLGDGRAIPALIDALPTASTWTRNRILYILGASKDARALEPLIEALHHSDPSTQGVGAWGLGALRDPQAFDPLCDLLDSPHASVRGNGAWGLGELGDPRALPLLVPLLQDRAPEVRAKTAWALGTLAEQSGMASVVGDLLPLLQDYTEVKDASAHVFVCQYAAEALEQIGTDEAKQAVQRWKNEAREHLLPHWIADAIRALRHKEADLRDRALFQLRDIGAPALPALFQALQSNDNARIRQGVAQVLGDLGDVQAVPVLSVALADPDVGVWSQAVGALAKLGKKAEKALRPLLTSPKLRVQQGAGIALWRICKEERAFKLLLGALQETEIVVQSSAVHSLWLQPDERAVATLQIQLEKADEFMARYILQALQTIGTPTAQATIRHWLQHHPL